MIIGRLFFQGCFPIFHGVLRLDSNHFSSMTDLIPSRCSSLILLEGTCYLNGRHFNQCVVYVCDSLHHISQTISSLQDIWCSHSNLPQLPEGNHALHSGFCLNLCPEFQNLVFGIFGFWSSRLGTGSVNTEKDFLVSFSYVYFLPWQLLKQNNLKFYGACSCLILLVLIRV